MLLVYVDDSLYFSTSDDMIKDFRKSLSDRFEVGFMGYAHWFLSLRISQDKNYNITVDQDRYARMLTRRHLGDVVIESKARKHDRTLPDGFVASKQDESKTEEEATQLGTEYRIDYASAIGGLIYLIATRPDITFAVTKLAKFMKKPGRKHYLALMWLLRYLRENPSFGITYYSNMAEAPITRILNGNNISQDYPVVIFCDSSWQDCPDTGRSTGCYHIYFQGGIVDHGTFVPSPVAQSSAEAEYNTAAVATMSTSHVRMTVNEFLGYEADDLVHPIQILLDSQSATAMGKSFKDTKHTRHIARRYHYVRQGEEDGIHNLNWIPAELNTSDIGTKNLPGYDISSRMEYCMVEVKE